MSERLLEFENMRGIAILAVVIIHVTAEATVTFSTGTISYYFYNIVNSFFQFAVPLFLFISSVILSWKLSNTEESLTKFYRKRLRGVLLPYLLWSFLYIALKVVLSRDMGMLSWSFLGKELLNGTAYYHLYFLLIIAQLYLFLPLCKPFLQKMKFGLVLILTVFLQVLFYYLNKNWIYPYYPHPANLLGSYFSVFIIGCWLGLNYQQAKTFLLKYKRYFGFTYLLLTVLFILVNTRLRMGLSMSLAAYYSIYHLFVLSASLYIWIISLQKQASILKGFGDYSFSIYLVHPFFLSVWFYLWQAAGLASASHFFYLLGFFFTIVLSYLTGVILAKWEILRRIFLAR